MVATYPTFLRVTEKIQARLFYKRSKVCCIIPKKIVQELDIMPETTTVLFSVAENRIVIELQRKEGGLV